MLGLTDYITEQAWEDTLYWSEMDSVHATFVVGDLSPQHAAEAATTNAIPMHSFDFRSV